ncbi:MAG: SRPBCC family protein [Ilumatobacter sp.]|nr:SRPBCC family protein [Ilumatobacter sp.]
MSDASTEPVTDRETGSATTTIAAPVADVFAAVTDVTRMGEWSPECVAGRWVGAEGPAVGARFQGDNVVAFGPVPLKRWSTTSEVVGYEPNALFEFVTEGHTNWRYEFAERDGGTEVTESFSYPPYLGWQKWVYGRLANRRTAMTKGMAKTLGRIKESLER